MTKIYIASYGLLSQLEHDQDTPSVWDMDLEHFASPQFNNVSADLASALSSAQNDVIDEVAELDLEEEDGGCIHAKFMWKNKAWTVPENGREHQVSELFYDSELIATVVVQLIEL